MVLTNYDFRNTHFEHKSPTKIRGEPTFDTLTTLYNEIKVNAQQVPSNNGGGNYGHLGLVITANDYQLLSLTPFVRPHNPGRFTIPPNQQLTADDINILHDTQNN